MKLLESNFQNYWSDCVEGTHESSDWTFGCPNIWSHIILGVSVRVFLDDYAGTFSFLHVLETFNTLLAFPSLFNSELGS